MYGFPRATNDVDLVAALEPRHVDAFITRITPEFVVDVETVRSAVRNRRAFNLIRSSTVEKVDVVVLADQQWQREEMARRRPIEVIPGDPTEVVYFSSPEDTILSKLEWYRRGREVSDRQWSDVLAILKVQGEELDLDYLRYWAEQLGVADLVSRAVREVERVE